MSSFNHYDGDTFDHVEDETIRAFLTADKVDESTCTEMYHKLWAMLDADRGNDYISDDVITAREHCVDLMNHNIVDGFFGTARDFARMFFRV